MKGNTPIVNGIILAAVFVYLTYYFTANGMWNPATVIVILLIGMLSAGQFIIWKLYFRDIRNDKKHKQVNKQTKANKNK